MLVDVDEVEVHGTSGSRERGEPDRRSGTAESHNGTRYEWQIETNDGRTAVFTINNVEYDLASGAVFRIDISGDEATVQQFNRDLTNVQSNQTSCNNFVTADPELNRTAEKSKTE